MSLDVVGRCWVSLDVVGCWMLLDAVGCHWMLLDVVGCCCHTAAMVMQSLLVGYFVSQLRVPRSYENAVAWWPLLAWVLLGVGCCWLLLAVVGYRWLLLAVVGCS